MPTIISCLSCTNDGTSYPYRLVMSKVVSGHWLASRKIITIKGNTFYFLNNHQQFYPLENYWFSLSQTPLTSSSYKWISVHITYRDFHTPEFSSHLASQLKSNLGCHSHEWRRFAEGAANHTLAGSGAVHTEVLLHTVIFVLTVAGEDHHHLTQKQMGGFHASRSNSKQETSKHRVDNMLVKLMELMHVNGLYI